MLQSSSPFNPAQTPPDLPPSAAQPAATPQAQDGDAWDYAELCLEQTAAAIHEARAATPTELNQAISAAREFHVEDKPADLIEILARVQGHDEENIGPAILSLGNKVASTITPTPQLMPFAGKLIAPSAFYDSFDRIHEISRVLLSPVIFAEDTDAIGTASINPVASMILSDEIRTAVFKRFGIRPFLTVARLDYETWSFLTRKHFEL